MRKILFIGVYVAFILGLVFGLSFGYKKLNGTDTDTSGDDDTENATGNTKETKNTLLDFPTSFPKENITVNLQNTYKEVPAISHSVTEPFTESKCTSKINSKAKSSFNLDITAYPNVGSLVTSVTSIGTFPDLQIDSIDNKPIVAYVDGTTLYYIAAKDMYGAEWYDKVAVETSWATNNKFILKNVNDKPTLFWANDGGVLTITTGTDVPMTSVTVATLSRGAYTVHLVGGISQYMDVQIIDGKVCVLTYGEDGGASVFLIIYKFTTFGSYDSYTEHSITSIVSPAFGVKLLPAVYHKVQGTTFPAVVYGNVNNLYFVRGTAANGEGWDSGDGNYISALIKPESGEGKISAATFGLDSDGNTQVFVSINNSVVPKQQELYISTGAGASFNTTTTVTITNTAESYNGQLLSYTKDGTEHLVYSYLDNETDGQQFISDVTDYTTLQDYFIDFDFNRLHTSIYNMVMINNRPATVFYVTEEAKLYYVYFKDIIKKLKITHTAVGDV